MRLVLLIFMVMPLTSCGSNGGDGGTDGDSTGQDGQDGQDGADGTDATDGDTDGLDGFAGNDGTNGTDATDATDGQDGQTGVAGEDRVFQGTHSTEVTNLDVTDNYSGKAAVKLRDSGVFSGTGSGSSADDTNPFELKLTGQVIDGTITGTLTWTWLADDAPPPVDMTLTGSLLGTTFKAGYQGGDQVLKYAGQIFLEEVD